MYFESFTELKMYFMKYIKQRLLLCIEYPKCTLKVSSNLKYLEILKLKDA